MPPRILEAMQQAWPDGIVDLPDNLLDDARRDTYSKLKAELMNIPGARLKYERGPQIESKPDEELRSYWVFFLSPVEDHFEFTTTTKEPDENWIMRDHLGKGWMGCMAAISLVAPFAVVRLDEYQVIENLSWMDPDVDPHMVAMNMGKLDLDEHFREMVLDEGLAILRKLEAGIVDVLEASGITIIPEAVLDLPVPWLSAGKSVIVQKPDEPITVQKAFFFPGHRKPRTRRRRDIAAGRALILAARK